MNELFQYSIYAIISISSGLILGIVFEKIILSKLERLSNNTKWEGDEIIINSLRGISIFLFIITGIYIGILNFPLSPSLINIIHKVFVITIILSVTILIARIAVGLIKIQTRNLEGLLPTTTIFLNLTRIIIFILGFLIIFNTLGISITPILTALGVGGVAVALALQDTLSNLFAGLQIMASRQIKPGDYVKLSSGEEGYVVDITWRNTTIKSLPNNMIIIPNSQLSSSLIVNYYQPDKEVAVLINVGVSYDSDLNKVEQVTIEVAKEVMREVAGGVPSFEPFIRYHTFSDFSIDFTVILRAKEFVDQYLIKHEFVKRLHQRYKSEDIEIPFPIRTVYMKENS